MVTRDEKQRSVAALEGDSTRRQKEIRAILRIARTLIRQKNLKLYAEALIRAGEDLIRAEQEFSRAWRQCATLPRESIDGEIMKSWLHANEHYICARELLVVYQTLAEADLPGFEELQKACGEDRERFEKMREELSEFEETVIESVFVIRDSSGEVISADDESEILPFDHNKDYSVVIYRGIPYTLKGVDRIVVQLCIESKGSVVTMDMIREACNKERRSFNTFKMSNIFSGKNRELWGTLIRPLGSGYVIDKT